MSRICVSCGKIPVMGKTITRRGMARRKGGAGKKITGTSHRMFKPNIQQVKVITPQGKRTVSVCTRCLKANKIKKAPIQPKTSKPTI